MTARPLAGRLVGGFIQPIEADVLHEAVRDAIATTRLGDLEPIHTLPDTNRRRVSYRPPPYRKVMLPLIVAGSIVFWSRPTSR
jgi:hypothetical protein